MVRLGVLALAALFCSLQPAVAAEWELLGERVVDFSGERDRIQVTAREGRFTRVKFAIEQNGIVLDWIKIHFANGETKDFDPGQPLRLQAGSESRAFDLPGERRIIQAIEFKYRSQVRQPRRRGKAQIKAWGLRAGADPTPNVDADDRPRNQPVEEWVSLGEKTVGFGVDTDRIAVTAREGRFTKVRFKVSDNAMILDWIKVHFRNGGVHEINPPQPLRLAEGAQSSPFDLPGDERVIKEIELKYRTPARKARRGRAKVEAIGLRVGRDPTPNAGGGQRPQPAGDGGWESLGTKAVGFGADTDRIGVTAREGLFTKVRVKVTQNALLFDWLKVHFANGEVFEINPSAAVRINAGAQHVWDLPGNKRIIQAISFKYRTPLRQAPRGRAQVEVFGKR